MPVVQHAHKEVQLKIVYYGAGLGGKTTNLQFLHAHSRPELRGKLLSLATEGERTIFFDLLPVSLGTFKGYSIRLHLCTVPGQIAYDRTRQLILRHVDGIVFVVDSQREALSSNLASVANLATNLQLQGDDPHRLPMVVQYNKRDLNNVLSVPELHQALGIPDGVPEIEACARQGMGVGETLKQIVKACLHLLGDPAQVPEGRSASILPGQRVSMFPGARPQGFSSSMPPASERASVPPVVIPPAPPLPNLSPRDGSQLIRKSPSFSVRPELQSAQILNKRIA